MDLSVLFLGTAGSMPTVQRAPASLLIRRGADRALIDCGVQVINPVQVNAEGMDPERLKREFGADLCFWGGVDTQWVLPYGSPGDVAAEVRRRLADLGRGGGCVLASAHNIQA
jgi:hypothetical protein